MPRQGGGVGGFQNCLQLMWASLDFCLPWPRKVLWQSFVFNQSGWVTANLDEFQPIWMSYSWRKRSTSGHLLLADSSRSIFGKKPAFQVTIVEKWDRSPNIQEARRQWTWVAILEKVGLWPFGKKCHVLINLLKYLKMHLQKIRLICKIFCSDSSNQSWTRAPFPTARPFCDSPCKPSKSKALQIKPGKINITVEAVKMSNQTRENPLFAPLSDHLEQL